MTLDDLTPEVRQVIIDHTVHCQPMEACGLIIRRDGILHAVPCENVAGKPYQDFQIAPAQYREIAAAGKVEACFHSHPYGPNTFSDADHQMSNRIRLPYVLLSWPNMIWDLYVPDGKFILPLEGRQFVWGVTDCFALLQDYFGQLGINVPNYHREWEWENKGQNLFLEHFTSGGFVQVEGPLRLHDVLLIQYGNTPVPNHCMIWVGDGQVLHHAPGRPSGREVYISGRGYFSRHTWGIYAHRDLLHLREK